MFPLTAYIHHFLRDNYGPDAETFVGPAAQAKPQAAGSGYGTLYLFVFTQFRTQNRYALLLELL